MKIGWGEWDSELRNPTRRGRLVVDFHKLLGDDWEMVAKIWLSWLQDKIVFAHNELHGTLIYVQKNEIKKVEAVLKELEQIEG